MKLLLLLALLVAASDAASIVDPSTCSSYPCLIFEDDFDYFDFYAWEHEINLSGGGNWEFQAYVNNRSVTYTHDSTLFIKPQLTADWIGEDALTTGSLDFWGSQGRNEKCTGNSFYGCERTGAGGTLNPIMSGRIRTMPFFSVNKGRVEIRAKMPAGDWLWPALWMLPKNYEYGLWPASGEIDINESRGNKNYGELGVGYGAQTLHWGPDYFTNQYTRTHVDYSAPSGETFADNFHTYGVEWNDDTLTFSLDGNDTLVVNPGNGGFFDYGQLNSTGYDNPWRYGSKMAPFDQEFFLTMNLAVGGTTGFFPDDVTNDPAKPWSNTETTAPASFWGAKDDWLPTWTNGEDTIQETAALQVDSVKVWKMS